jgi:hypothetical protein
LLGQCVDLVEELEVVGEVLGVEARELLEEGGDVGLGFEVAAEDLVGRAVVSFWPWYPVEGVREDRRKLTPRPMGAYAMSGMPY